MEIVVNVEDINLGAVVQHGANGDPLILADVIAEHIVQQLRHDEQWNTARKLIADTRKETVQEAVTVEIVRALNEPVRQTNSYGESTGPEVTIRELILKETKDFLAKQTGDSYSRDRRTVAQKLVADMVTKELATELKAVFDDEKKKVVAAVRAKASEMVTEAAKKAAGL